MNAYNGLIILTPQFSYPLPDLPVPLPPNLVFFLKSKKEIIYQSDLCCSCSPWSMALLYSLANLQGIVSLKRTDTFPPNLLTGS